MSDNRPTEEALADAYMNLYQAACRLRTAEENLHEAEVSHRRAIEAIEELEDERG